MKVSKNIKLKIFVLVAFILLMFVQIGPYLLYADENELTFSYRRIELVATNEYYNSNRLFFSEAYVGQNIAYCLDYGVPLPVSSGGTVKFVRQLNGTTTAALVYGYPNVSAASLGVNSNEEAMLATQLAVWRLARASGESQKSDYILDMDNLKPTAGHEEYMARVKAAAQRIIDRAKVEPYYANPTLNIKDDNAKLVVNGDTMLAGPYKINGNGFAISSVTVSLENQPASAILCDANGNAKSSFANGEDVYVKLNSNVGTTSFKLKVTEKGYHNAGKVYGTGVAGDAKQDYAFLTSFPDELTSILEVSLPELNGSIKVLKSDQYNTPLQGVTFELRDTSGKVLQTKQTDANGVIEFKNLKIGKYVVAETSSLNGYVMMDTPVEIEVKYNEVKEIPIENKKIEGGLKIIKYDETFIETNDPSKSKPIAGVVFQILDSNHNVVETLDPTNSEGVAVSGKLSVGTYYFKELSGPSNIVVDSSEHKFSITDPNVVEVYKVGDYYTRGRLKITKSTEDNKPIEGVVFQILDENKKEVQQVTTDANGYAQTKKLKYGTYYLKELSAPESAKVVVDGTEQKFVMEYTDKDITVTNKYAKGKLKVVKTGDDGRVLQGVVFNILDSNKNVVDTITTDEKGEATSKDLKLGTYYYQEIKAPENVIMDGEVYDFSLAKDGQVITKNIENELIKTGKLKIIKVDELKRPLENVVFEILDSNKNVVDTITTDKDGIAVTKELPLGSYTYREKSVPKGVVKDPNEYPFKLSKNGTVVEKNVKNTLERGSLSIYKVDENGNYLENVTFTLIDENGKEIDKKTTGKDGLAKFENLLPGNYNFKETDAPVTVVPNKEPKPIKITVDKLNVDVKVTNELSKGSLRIVKTDELGNKLEGVTFEILDSDKKVVDTITTDKTGVAVSKKLVLGTYYYRETKAPKGVIIDKNEYEFKLTKNDQVVTKNVENELERGVLSIYKVDENGNYLENVTFTLVDEEGNEIAKKTTGKDGIVKFENLLPGNYNFKETDAPATVVPNKEPQPIEITVDKLNVDVKVTNELSKGSLQIVKTDENGDKLEGVVFEILDSDKNVIEEITTDKNGVAVSKELTLGTYYYKEKEAPKGVIIDNKEYQFKLTENEQIVTKEIVNKLERGSISIFKVDEDGNYLENVTFTLVDEKGNEIDKQVTGKDGLAKFENLLPGNYNFKEVDAPVNVVKNENPQPIEITVDDLNVEVTVENEFARGMLRIIKTDMADKKLKGVKFEILNSDKQVIEELVTNEEGIIESQKLLIGKYYFREVSAEDPNIIVDNKLYDFKITENDQVVTATIKNKTVNGAVIITKVDSSNSKLVLKGAKIQILDKDKNVLDTLVTDDNGQVKLSNLKVGTYYYKELEAPKGYILDSNEYKFEITKESQLREITFKNEAKRLPQTGGFISTNVLIVIIVTVVSVVGYVSITIIAKNKKEQNS